MTKILIFLCSYDNKLIPRNSDGKLRYSAARPASLVSEELDKYPLIQSIMSGRQPVYITLMVDQEDRVQGDSHHQIAEAV
ncbi:hypothetical protein LINPERHAP2_LOCUS15111 [Linum perenne]